MTMYRKDTAYPDDPAPQPGGVKRVVTELENNRRAVTRWFWRFLFAFNLLLASVALWAVAVLRLGQ